MCFTYLLILSIQYLAHNDTLLCSQYGFILGVYSFKIQRDVDTLKGSP